MDIHRTLEDFDPLSSSVVTIGSYDGLHRGHLQIINRVQSIAQSVGTTSIVMTFEPHPRCVIDKDSQNIKLIMSLEKKIQIFRFRSSFLNLLQIRPFKQVLVYTKC